MGSTLQKHACSTKTRPLQIHCFQTRPLLAFSLFLIGWPAPGGRDFRGPAVGWPSGPDCDETDCGEATVGPDCDEADCGGANAGPDFGGADYGGVVCGRALAGPGCDEAPAGLGCD